MSPEISFIIGLVLLLVAAEALVRSASRLAAYIGLSPLVIGLTVVAFGTSSPEIAIGLISSLDAHTDTGFGNIIGSNIFNILFILGFSALLRPLTLRAQVVRFDAPFLVVSSLFVFLLSLNMKVGRVEGIVMLTALIMYTVIVIALSRRERSKIREQYRKTFTIGAPASPLKLTLTASALVVSIIVLGVSSRLVVSGAVSIATDLGISEFFIGLTVIAVGTSLPEIATSVFAFIRGEQDIGVGNILGSCIFNLFGVLGIMSLVSGTIAVPVAAFGFDLPVAIACAVITLPLFFTGYQLSRREGLLLLLYYAVFIAVVTLSSTGHISINEQSVLPGIIVLALGVITVAVSLGKYYIDRKLSIGPDTKNAGDAL